jgi:hypothetical protein
VVDRLTTPSRSRLILAGQLDPKIAGLLLYALQTGSLNLRHMKLEPFHHESVVIDPRSVADNGLDDNAWSKEEFEEEEEEDEEEGEDEDGGEEDSDKEDADEEDAAEEGEEEDSAEADEEESEDEKQRAEYPQKSPVHVARAACPERAEGPTPASRPPLSSGFRRPPGADKNAIVVNPDENAFARQLLKLVDFAQPTPK